MLVHYARHAVSEYMEQLPLASRQQQSWGGVIRLEFAHAGFHPSGVFNACAYVAPDLQVGSHPLWCVQQLQ